MKRDIKLTREKALQIIRKHLIAQVPRDFEIQDGIPDGCTFYGIDKVKAEPCWTAFIPSQETRTGSSHIICISKKTGRILYDGFTNGE